MNCLNHQEKEASGACVYCGKLFCSDCLVEIEGKNYCKSDVGNVLKETIQRAEKKPETPMIFMNAGGGGAASSSASSSSGGHYNRRGVSCLDVILIVLTGGIWLIWMAVRR